jgi:predicted O-methyltransferase YrrM
MQFSPAEALWNNRERLSQALPEIRLVRETLERGVGGRRDFIRQQWLQLASVVVEFKPDLILELGRGYGNSLCAMALALKMLRPRSARLVSICLASEFAEVSRPYLETHLADPSLLAPVEALTENILDHDFGADLKMAERVLVFWDAHGYELAIDLLGRLFPLLADKTHLALVHDMADLAHVDSAYRRYDSAPLWHAMGSAPPKYILGDVGSQYEEGIALVDFLGRNGIPFRSAEASYFPELADHQVAELERRFGEDFSQLGFWYHFSLNDAGGRTVDFPSPMPRVVEEAAGGPALDSSRRPSLLQRILARKSL